MDAVFIHGMLNSPNVQPNVVINRWIAAILLFDFKLVHVPAEKHQDVNMWRPWRVRMTKKMIQKNELTRLSDLVSGLLTCSC